MGIDAMIFFKSEKDEPIFARDLSCATFKKLTTDDYTWASGATHRVHLSGNDRFYGKHYEPGVWPVIAGVLMELFASPDITAVYYGGDSFDEILEITPSEVCEISLHYMKVGNRPYREIFQTPVVKP